MTDEGSWGADLLKNVPEGMYTRAQAARLIGRHKDTLRAWHRDGLFEPTEFIMAGQTKIWLYTDQDIVNLQEIANHQRRGRKDGASG